LLQKILAAAHDMTEHVISHWQLESTLSKSDIEQWMLAVEAWEADSSLPNPFRNTMSGIVVALAVVCHTNLYT
jgi:hypothetical protein